MVLATQTQTSFTQGQLSPKVRSRIDIQQYSSGAEIIRNFVPEIQGPATYRAGSRFIIGTKNNNPAALFRFQFNDEQSYILEFTNTKLRIFLNEGILLEASQSITNITQTNPAVVTYVGADNFDNGKEVFISGVEGMTEINNKFFTIANVNTGSNTFELLGIDSTSFTAYSSGGDIAQVFELDTPYLTDELFELQLAQNKDTLYIAHKNHNPRILTRISATVWTLITHVPTGITFGGDDNPAAVTFYEQRLVYAGTNNDPQKIFFSKSADINDFTTGTSDNDGLRYTIASRDSNTIKWLIGTSQHLVIGTFGGNFLARGNETNQAITPSNIFITPTDGIGAESQAPILKNDRVIFTQAGKQILRTFEFDLNSDGFLSRDRNIASDEITRGNIKQLAYQEGRPELVWCAKEDGELIGLSYKPEELVNGWHEHRTREGDKITSVATVSRSGDFDQLWIVSKRDIGGSDKYYVEFLEDYAIYPRREDSFTTLENKADDSDVFRNLLLESQKGYFHLDSGLTYNGSALSSETLTPSATTGTSISFTTSGSFFTSDMVGRQLWRKTITGREIGRAEITSFTSATQVDCKILVDFDSTDVIPAGEWYITSDNIGNIDHLEGEVVQIVTDGSIHPDKTVSNGSVNLDYQASVVHVGFKYTGIIKSMNLEVGGVAGTSQTKPKNIYKAGIKFDNSLGTRFGSGLYNTKQLLFRSTNSLLNNPPELFTGEKRISFNDSWTGEKHTVMIQDLPLPCSIQQIVSYVNTSN
jgi:hypothetical protein